MSVVQPARCQAFAPRASKPASQPCRPRSRGLLARSTGDFASISGRHQIPHFSPNAEELEEVRPGECQTRDEACNDVSRFDAGEIHSFVEEISIKKPSERGEMKLSEPLANHTTWVSCNLEPHQVHILIAQSRDTLFHVGEIGNSYEYGFMPI